MGPQNMPEADVTIEAEDVATLIASQYPPLAGARITEAAFGWDNYMFRVGHGHVARFPRRAVSAPMVAAEARWLPLLAPRLPLPIPTPVFHGEPMGSFPWTWTIAPWIEGEPATSADYDEIELAAQLGSFLAALHFPAPEDAPSNPFRGVPLSQRREPTRLRIETIDELVDASVLDDLWIEACDSETHSGPPMWLHGDLHPNNLIVRDGRLAGVIDFTDLTAGDPASDLMAGWTTFGPEAREVFFDSYGDVDAELLSRARGWAINHGTACLAHGADNPVMSQIGRTTLERVLAG